MNHRSTIGDALLGCPEVAQITATFLVTDYSLFESQKCG
jgi:hypothetical protein